MNGVLIFVYIVLTAISTLLVFSLSFFFYWLGRYFQTKSQYYEIENDIVSENSEEEIFSKIKNE